MGIKFIDAISELVLQSPGPIITDYELCLFAKKVEHDNGIYGKSLNRQRTPLTLVKVKRFAKLLEENKILTHDQDFRYQPIYRILHNGPGDADEVCCLVDPFGYISHLSAMRRHGITDRLPATLIFSTLSSEEWRKKRIEKMQEDLHFLESAQKDFSGFRLKQYAFPSKIRGLPIQLHTSKYPAETIQIQDSFARISNIGSTFVDMLDRPELCGGMLHVIEVWEDYARKFLSEIIDAVNRHPKKIIHVRAGYLLEEHLEINDERIKVWEGSVQRGSSRVLDSTKPFVGTFSEKWMLSLNA